MSQTFVPARNAPAAEYDRSLAWAALLLAAAGLVMVYSASIATAEANRYTGNSAAWFLARHSIFLAAALGVTEPQRQAPRPCGRDRDQGQWRAASAARLRRRLSPGRAHPVSPAARDEPGPNDGGT